MFIKTLLKNLSNKNNINLNNTYKQLNNLKHLQTSYLHHLNKMKDPDYVIKSNIKAGIVSSSIILFDLYGNNILQFGYISACGIGSGLCLIQTKKMMENYIKNAKEDLLIINKEIKDREITIEENINYINGHKNNI